MEGLGGEVVGEEEECVYPLGFPIVGEEFFIEVDVPFGIYARLGAVGIELDSAVDVIIIKGFVEVSSIAEDIVGGVPAIIVPLLGSSGSENRYIEGRWMQSCRVRWVPAYAHMKSPALANRLWYLERRV